MMNRLALSLLAALLAGPTPLHAQFVAERATVAREAWRRAAAAQQEGLPPDSLWADLLRAQAAWPAQPAYSAALARFAAERGDTAVLERALLTLAAQEVGGSLVLDSALEAAAARSAGGIVALAKLRQSIATREHSRPRVVYQDTMFFAEGLDVDTRSGTAFITSIGHRAVFAWLPDGRMHPVLNGVENDVAAPLGVAVDTVGDVLWVTAAALAIMEGYQAADSARTELLRVRIMDGSVLDRWTLGSGTGIPGELALTPSGDVLVSDGTLSRLYRLRAGSKALETIDHPLLRSPQGIAVSARGDVAWIADWAHGLLRWDLQTDSISAVRTPDNVTLVGIDGLRRAGNQLIGVQNGVAPTRIVGITLDETGASIRSVRTLDRPASLPGEPTVGAPMGDRYLYVASAAWPFWTYHGQRRPDSGPLPPVLIRELPLPR